MAVPLREAAEAAHLAPDAAVLLVTQGDDDGVPWSALNGHGLHLLRARDMARAIAICGRTRIAVVVMDLETDDGIRLAQRLRALNPGWTEYLFISTAAARTPDSDMLLRKPVEAGALLEAVTQAFNLARMQRFQQEQAFSLDDSLAEFQAQTQAAVTQLIARTRRAGGARPVQPSADSKTPPQSLPPEVLAAELHRTRLREKLFGAAVRSHASWLLLLVLADSHMSGARLTIKSAAYSAGIPLSSALRKLNEMCAMGLVERHEDLRDARRSFVYLTPDGQSRMAAYFGALQQQEAARPAVRSA